ncbi:MAG: imidazoleglycerol-phosphate dehydratase HisB [candidate division KSB1 bacterium]|nr:imidazoleglycerol-phosphate dehydratase HisB [candidate division KSB1 bacterium]
MNRNAEFHWKTREVEATVQVAIDGSGSAAIDTGIGFLDHLLETFARNALVDLELKARGDLEVDAHHTVEDVGIALGIALRQALGDKDGIYRYGWVILPMDDALVQLALDLGGRPYFSLVRERRLEKVGQFDGELAEEFLRALVNNLGMNLHIEVLAGWNTHHILEAMFKALGRAFRMAAERDPRTQGVPSTKGSLQ